MQLCVPRRGQHDYHIKFKFVCSLQLLPDGSEVSSYVTTFQQMKGNSFDAGATHPFQTHLGPNLYLIHNC